VARLHLESDPKSAHQIEDRTLIFDRNEFFVVGRAGAGKLEHRIPNSRNAYLDAPLTFSAKHAELRYCSNDRQFFIENLADNLTFVNGRRVKGKTVLNQGDQIVLGRGEEFSLVAVNLHYPG
jgi:hypothetical protein